MMKLYVVGAGFVLCALTLPVKMARADWIGLYPSYEITVDSVQPFRAAGVATTSFTSGSLGGTAVTTAGPSTPLGVADISVDVHRVYQYEGSNDPPDLTVQYTMRAWGSQTHSPVPNGMNGTASSHSGGTGGADGSTHKDPYDQTRYGLAFYESPPQSITNTQTVTAHADMASGGYSYAANASIFWQ